MCWDEVEDLVCRARLGDRDAYGELVKRFRGSVYAYALTRVHDATEADELTQEVFIHAMRKLGQLRDPRCFGGWLRRIAARMAINRGIRRGRVHGMEGDFLDVVPGRERGPIDEIERHETKAELHEGLKLLKELDRETLVAFYFRGQSLKQMSRHFETPVGTIKRRLHVARLRLKEVLESEGFTELDEGHSRDAELMNAI